MKVPLAIATAVLAFVSVTFGQAGQSQPQTNQPSTSTTQPSGTPHKAHRHGRMHHHQAKMQEHMQEMQAHMKDMQSRIARLRTDAQKVKDPETRTALLDAVDIWEQMMSHMQKHMQGMRGHHGMMKDHGMADHGMMDHGGMQHHMDMMDDEHGTQQPPSEKEGGSEGKPQ